MISLLYKSLKKGRLFRVMVGIETLEISAVEVLELWIRFFGLLGFRVLRFTV